MTKKKVKKWFLGVIGLICITSITTELSKYVFLPLYKTLMEIFLKVTTLGLSSLSNSFYKKVAWALHEDPSIHLISIVFMSAIAVVAYLCLDTFSNLRVIKKRDIKLKREDKSKQYDNLSDEEIGTLLQKYETLKRKSIFSHRILIVAFLVTFFLLNVQYLSYSYRYHLVAVFRQKFTAVKTLMNENEEDLILCKFTGIKSKQDYLDIIKELKQKVEALEIQKINSDKKATQSKS